MSWNSKLCPDCKKPSPIFCEDKDGTLRCPECHETHLFQEAARRHQEGAVA